MPGILAIDQATVLAASWCLPGKEPAWETKRLGWTPKKGEDGPPRGVKYWELRNYVLHKIGLVSPDYLVAEAPWSPRPDRSAEAKPFNANTVRLGYGLVAHIEELAEEFSIEYREYQSPEVAKFFTGKGRFPGNTPEEKTAAKKTAVRAACTARGWIVSNYNESDALALMAFAEYQLYPREALSRRMVLKTPQGPLQSLLTTP